MSFAIGSVDYLFKLDHRAGLHETEILQGYEALVHVRNCIAHTSGLVKGYEHSKELPDDIKRLNGIYIGNWHFLGKYICIEGGALLPYIRSMANYIEHLYEACSNQELWKSDA